MPDSASARLGADYPDNILAGGGEAGELIREIDWANTPVGPMEGWPQSLRTSVSICLRSRFPILIWWGPELVMIYNDAYRPVVGGKHPRSMGQVGRECWPEVWDTIGPLLERVMQEGEANWAEDLLLPLNRKGFAEECYFTFSYSPIADESGGVGGVFTAVTETTQKVLSERRLRSLRDLVAAVAVAKTAERTCMVAVDSLRTNPADMPFASLYLIDGKQQAATLQASTMPADIRMLPACVDLSDPLQADPWLIAKVARSGKPDQLSHLERDFAASGIDTVCDAALVLPITSADNETVGVMVVGLSRRLLLDDSYRGFFDLLAGHIATGIDNARAYEREQRRAEELAELNRAKTAFFSNISHEFRTPLTLMLGPTEDALATPEQALGGDTLKTVYRNELRLLKLVNTLLDFARIEAGRIEASYESTQLAELTRDLASNFQSAIDRAGLGFMVSAPTLSEAVYVDREMWEKIVFNLLSNALKFTFSGQIEVALRELSDSVELKVRDTGTGIVADQLPLIFERFHRIQGARSRTHEGSGIGLSLVRELVNLHGGDVQVESEVDQGTTFTVILPKGTAHLPAELIGGTRQLASTALGARPYVEEASRWTPDPDTAAVTAAAENAAAYRPRIVLADDNADMRDYIRQLLGERFDVEAVNDGAAALAAIRRAPPDLVLTDIMMPEMDGFALLQALRADVHLNQVPVILLSARAGEEETVEGIEAGADDYLVKPFSARELIARVSTHLALGQAQKKAISVREEVLATVSHDLRTPLSAIGMYSRVLAKKLAAASEDAVVARSMNAIDRSVSSMRRMLDDLLDLSKIEGGRLAIERKREDAVELAREAGAGVAPMMDDKRLQLALKLPDESLPVLCDRDRILQVLNNLLSNALKFTPEGGAITLCAQAEPDAIHISVSDTGAGIASDELPHVFERHWQANKADRFGSGLGLAICKGIIEAHGGTIGVRSVIGEGSAFSFKLSRAE